MATYAEAWKQACDILDEHGEAFIVVSKLGGYYAARNSLEVGTGTIVQYSVSKCSEFNLSAAEPLGCA